MTNNVNQKKDIISINDNSPANKNSIGGQNDYDEQSTFT